MSSFILKLRSRTGLSIGPQIGCWNVDAVEGMSGETGLAQSNSDRRRNITAVGNIQL